MTAIPGVQNMKAGERQKTRAEKCMYYDSIINETKFLELDIFNCPPRNKLKNPHNLHIDSREANLLFFTNSHLLPFFL